MDHTREVKVFLKDLTPGRRHHEAAILDHLFRDLTGYGPRLWRGGILGYGTYDYTYASGRSGTYFATGFAPRKAKLSIYIMPGYGDFSEILGGLGKFKNGKSCFYINKLDDMNLAALRTLIRAGLDDLATQWPIHPT